MQLLREHSVKSLCVLPLTTALRRLGAMGVGSLRPRVYSQADAEFLALVARQVAVGVDNAFNYQDAQSYQQQLGRERDRLRLLLEINNALVANLDLRQLFTAISSSLRQVMHHDYTSLTLIEAESNQLRLHLLDFPQGKGIVQEEMVSPLADSLPAKAIDSRQPILLNKAADCEQARQSEMARRHLEEGLQAACCLPLISRDRVLGTLNVGSLRQDAFSEARMVASLSAPSFLGRLGRLASSRPSRPCYSNRCFQCRWRRGLMPVWACTARIERPSAKRSKTCGRRTQPAAKWVERTMLSRSFLSLAAKRKRALVCEHEPFYHNSGSVSLIYVTSH